MNTRSEFEREWVAAYYPAAVMQDDRAKTIACLLFDRIVCHFPIAHTGCGGGVGVSSAFCDDPLVEEGIIELREEFLLPQVEADFTDGEPWGTPEEFDRYLKLNVTAMALHCCRDDGLVPVTDTADVAIPAFVMEQFDLRGCQKTKNGTANDFGMKFAPATTVSCRLHKENCHGGRSNAGEVLRVGSSYVACGE